MTTLQIDHHQKFKEFVSYALATGDPDSHLKIAAHRMKQIEDDREKLWFAGCYCGPYNVISGLIINSYWSLQDVLSDSEAFYSWLVSNWRGLEIATERRAVRTPAKMYHSMISYARWANEMFMDEYKDYESLWLSANNEIAFFGRYIIIKLLEVMYQGGMISSRIPDIRPVDGWSPRKSLAWLYPQYEDICVGGNKASELEIVNSLSEELLASLRESVSSELSFFDIEVLLCNYRQLYESKKGKYPGYSQDATLHQYHKLRSYWKEYNFDLFEMRRELFNPYVLGEIQGWHGPREELNRCHKEFDYYWCDTVYSYQDTTSLAMPIRR